MPTSPHPSGAIGPSTPSPSPPTRSRFIPRSGTAGSPRPTSPAATQAVPATAARAASGSTPPLPSFGPSTGPSGGERRQQPRWSRLSFGGAAT
eukprot:10091712-Heterocapsa_arctica.AAC.1